MFPVSLGTPEIMQNMPEILTVTKNYLPEFWGHFRVLKRCRSGKGKKGQAWETAVSWHFSFVGKSDLDQ